MDKFTATNVLNKRRTADLMARIARILGKTDDAFDHGRN